MGLFSDGTNVPVLAGCSKLTVTPIFVVFNAMGLRWGGSCNTGWVGLGAPLLATCRCEGAFTAVVIQGNTPLTPSGGVGPSSETPGVDAWVDLGPIFASCFCHVLAVVGVIYDPGWPFELLACPDNIPHVGHELRHMLRVPGGQDTCIDAKTLDPGGDIRY